MAYSASSFGSFVSSVFRVMLPFLNRDSICFSFSLSSDRVLFSTAAYFDILPQGHDHRGKIFIRFSCMRNSLLRQIAKAPFF